MHEKEVVTTANLVLKAPHSSKLDEDCLWYLILLSVKLLHDGMTLRIKLGIDVEDGLLNLLRVEHDGTVAARDDVLLLLNTLDQGVNRGSEASLKHFFLHFEFLL